LLVAVAVAEVVAVVTLVIGTAVAAVAAVLVTVAEVLRDKEPVREQEEQAQEPPPV
jgi:hypothetical protein